MSNLRKWGNADVRGSQPIPSQKFDCNQLYFFIEVVDPLLG